MDTSPDPSRPYTVWSGLIGGMFLAMAYFGCDQSQVQRYLSGRSLTESRLSLLFNAFLKVPMQFLILLTGVLVFVFFHFHETPLLWNRAELARLEAQAPPAELARVRDEVGAAHRERQRAAEAFARARHDGGDVASAREGYLAAQRRVDAAEAATRRLASSVAGAAGQRRQLHLPELHRRPAPRRPRRPHHRRDLRGRDVDPGRRAQLARHRDDGGLLLALRPRGRQPGRRPARLPRSSRRSGASSPRSWPCRPASSAPPSRS